MTLNTSSGTWIAVFNVCSYLPQFLVSLVGGVWADRYHRKKLIIGADTAIAAVTFFMMLVMPCIGNGQELLGSLLLMSALRSVGAGIQTPAVNALVPQLVPENQLMRFNGINAAMQSFVQFAAPAAAGALLTASTLRSTLMIDVLTAIAGVGIVSCLFIPMQDNFRKSASVLKDMKNGFRYAFSDRLIGRVLVVYGLFTFFCVPAGFLAGLLVSRVYGDTYWYLTAVELAGFAGMMAGGVIISIWGGFKNRLATLRAGLAVFGAMAIGMALSRNFIFYLSLMVLYGIALTTVQTATTTIIQEKVELSVQGRVFGLLGSMYSGFMPLGMAIFGPMADAIPLQWIMAVSGLALILISAA